jgi:hypothetical protein
VRQSPAFRYELPPSDGACTENTTKITENQSINMLYCIDGLSD